MFPSHKHRGSSAYRHIILLLACPDTRITRQLSPSHSDLLYHHETPHSSEVSCSALLLSINQLTDGRAITNSFGSPEPGTAFSIVNMDTICHA